METTVILMEIYGKPRLFLSEVAESIGISLATAYTRRSTGRLKIPMSGSPLTADIRDVANYLDAIRSEGNADSSV